jgi:hypothetical protein
MTHSSTVNNLPKSENVVSENATFKPTSDILESNTTCIENNSEQVEPESGNQKTESKDNNNKRKKKKKSLYKNYMKKITKKSSKNASKQEIQKYKEILKTKMGGGKYSKIDRI